METRGEQRPIIWGLLLIVLGLLLLLGNLGYRTWIAWDRWWPVLLIAVGVVMLYRRNAGAGTTSASTAESPPAPGAEILPRDVGPATPEPSAAGAGEASPPRRYPTAAILLIGIGVAFLLDDLVGGNAFPAFVLIAIGLALILRERR